MPSTPSKLRGLPKSAQSMMPELRRIMRSYTDNWFDTADLLQELSIRLLRCKGSDPLTARDRIRQLAHEVGGKWHCACKRAVAIQSRLRLLYGRDDHADQTLESMLDTERRLEFLLQVIAECPERRLQAWYLVKFEGYSCKEAARTLNVSPGTIEVHLRNGMRACRRRLLSQGGIDEA